jgi:hypothetical protein
MLAYKDGQRVRLVSRKGRDRTSRFADLAAAISRLSARTLALDGEVAIYDPQLRSRFDWLRERPRRLGADRRQRLRGPGREGRGERLRGRGDKTLERYGVEWWKALGLIPGPAQRGDWVERPSGDSSRMLY